MRLILSCFKMEEKDKGREGKEGVKKEGSKKEK